MERIIILCIILVILIYFCLNTINKNEKFTNVNKIPIIIFHKGVKEYVKICINQALKWDNHVILLNDNPEDYKDIQSSNFECVNYSKYSQKANKLSGLFENFSLNKSDFELICIKRWLYVEEFMKQRKIDRAFVCDSDILIFDNISKINSKYLYKYDYMLCSSPSKNLTGGQSIWNLNKLSEFSEFTINFYNKDNKKRMRKWWKNYKNKGGICDMTILYYFSVNETKFNDLRIDNKPLIKNDLTQIFDNLLTFDLHLRAAGNEKYPDEYKMTNGIKNIVIKNNQPYVFNKRMNKDIRFVLLHFQGNIKSHMKKYSN
jgi:hypothetical protein